MKYSIKTAEVQDADVAGAFMTLTYWEVSGYGTTKGYGISLEDAVLDYLRRLG